MINEGGRWPLVVTISATEAGAGSTSTRNGVAEAFTNANFPTKVLYSAGAIRRALATSYERSLLSRYKKPYEKLMVSQKESEWRIFYTLLSSLSVAGPHAILDYIKDILVSRQASATTLDNFDVDQKAFSKNNREKAFWNLIPESIHTGLLTDILQQPSVPTVIIVEGKLSFLLPFLYTKELGSAQLDFFRAVLTVPPLVSAMRVFQRELLDNTPKYTPPAFNGITAEAAKNWCLEECLSSIDCVNDVMNGKLEQFGKYKEVAQWFKETLQEIYSINQRRIAKELWEDVDIAWGDTLALPRPITQAAVMAKYKPDGIYPTDTLTKPQVVTALLTDIVHKRPEFSPALLSHLATYE
jgi:hypothetical protein